jgi:hypothetical protein
MISIHLEMLGKSNDYNNVLPFVYKDNMELIKNPRGRAAGYFKIVVCNSVE